MAKKDDKEAKRVAIVKRLCEMHDSLDVLSGMWDDKSLDALILALGIGRVELSE